LGLKPLQIDPPEKLAQAEAEAQAARKRAETLMKTQLISGKIEKAKKQENVGKSASWQNSR